MLNTLQCIGIKTSCIISISIPWICSIIWYGYFFSGICYLWQYCQIQVYQAIAIIGNNRFQCHRILTCLIIHTTIPDQCITIAESISVCSWSNWIMNIQIQCNYTITTICIIKRHRVSDELICSSVLLIIPIIGVTITNCLVNHRRLNLVTNYKIQFLDHTIATILIRNNMNILFLYRTSLTIPVECLTRTDCLYLNRFFYCLRMNGQVQDINHTITCSICKWHAHGV